MGTSARKGLLVDGARDPFAEEDSGTVELPDDMSVLYRAIAPDNAAAIQRFHHRLIEAALERGIGVLTGVFLFENKRMLNLPRDLGLPETLRYEQGIEHVEIGLQRPGSEEGS